MDRKSPSQIFKDYQTKLLHILPMDDAVFNALLVKNSFFTENHLLAHEPRATTVPNFLAIIIGHNIDKYFGTLLNVMEVFGGPVATLAQEIKEKIGIKSYQGALCRIFTLVFVFILYE